MPKVPRVYKQRARFYAVAKCILPTTVGKQTAAASISDLKMVLPSDFADYEDLLPIAGNVSVANLGNQNGDLVDTEVALSLMPRFVHKYINLEHDPKIIVGHLTKSGLTSFSPSYNLGAGSSPISAEDVQGTDKLFNVAVGGYVYGSLLPGIAKKLVEANDPSHPAFLSIAFSWELAFDDNKLLVGSAEMGEGRVIDDPKLIEEWRPFLKCHGGNGTTPDGEPLYRLVSFARLEDGSNDISSVIPMGVALTLAPAGHVAGVLTASDDDEESEETESNDDESITIVASVNKNIDKSNKNISQNSATIVTIDTQMKTLKNLDDVLGLNDESAKDFSFANINNIVSAGISQQIADSIKEVSADYSAKLKAKEDELAKTVQNAAAAVKELEEVKATAAETAKRLAELEQAAAASKIQNEFNQRMSFFDEKYELDDTSRKAIASLINGLDEASFEKVKNEQLTVLLASKDKAALAAAKEAQSEGDKSDAAAKEAAQKALASAQSKEAHVGGTPTDTQQSLVAKFAEAFGEKAVTCTPNRR